MGMLVTLHDQIPFEPSLNWVVSEYTDNSNHQFMVKKNYLAVKIFQLPHIKLSHLQLTIQSRCVDN